MTLTRQDEEHTYIYINVHVLAPRPDLDIARAVGSTTYMPDPGYMTPLLSTIVSCVYLGILPGMMLWIGCALLVAGSYLSWRSVGDCEGDDVCSGV